MKCDNKSGEKKSLLDEIRSCVDANLRLIHETISKNLYEKLGLEPRQLFSVEKFETTNVKGQREDTSIIMVLSMAPLSLKYVYV